MRQHDLAGFLEMLAEAQRPLLVAAFQKVAQLFLSVEQRLAREVLAVEMEEVERVVDHALGALFRQRQLQFREDRDAIVGQNDDFAVENGALASRPAMAAEIASPKRCVQSSPVRV